MPDKWYETSARSSCTGVSLRWVAGAVDDTLIHVLSGAIEVTALKYGHVPRAVGIRMHLSGFSRTAAQVRLPTSAMYVIFDQAVDSWLFPPAAGPGDYNLVDLPYSFTGLMDTEEAGHATGPGGDIDGDGEVGPQDLALLLGYWGVCP